MRRAAIAIGMLTALSVHAELEVQYDRFTNRTTVTAPKFYPGTIPAAGFEVQALTFFDGDRPLKRPNMVLLSFKALSYDGWKYLQCHSVAALADGKPFSLPPAKHNGAAIRGAEVIETIYIEIPWATFVALTRADKLEFRVCTTEQGVSDERLQDFRALLRTAAP